MKLKLNIHGMFTNKFLSIPLILIFSVCLFMPNAFSSGCDDDGICFKCAQMDHHGATGPGNGIRPYGCQPLTPDNACGIATGRIVAGQLSRVSAIRVSHHQDSDTPSGRAEIFNGDLFFNGNGSPDHSSVVTEAPPIYLLNNSFLC